MNVEEEHPLCHPSGPPEVRPGVREHQQSVAIAPAMNVLLPPAAPHAGPPAPANSAPHYPPPPPPFATGIHHGAPVAPYVPPPPNPYGGHGYALIPPAASPAPAATTNTARGGRGGGGGQGGGQFSRAEVNFLLDIMEEVLPIGQQSWNLVFTRFQNRRTVESLRHKFNALCRKKTPTCDPNCPPEVRRAKRINEQIILRSGSTSLNLDEELEEELLLESSSVVAPENNSVGDVRTGVATGGDGAGAGSVVGGPAGLVVEFSGASSASASSVSAVSSALKRRSFRPLSKMGSRGGRGEDNNLQLMMQQEMELWEMEFKLAERREIRKEKREERRERRREKREQQEDQQMMMMMMTMIAGASGGGRKKRRRVTMPPSTGIDSSSKSSSSEDSSNS